MCVRASIDVCVGGRSEYIEGVSVAVCAVYAYVCACVHACVRRVITGARRILIRHRL
jgi:hypothetical protein